MYQREEGSRDRTREQPVENEEGPRWAEKTGVDTPPLAMGFGASTPCAGQGADGPVVALRVLSFDVL